MPTVSNPEVRRALAERIRYYNELGIYDFYRREGTAPSELDSAAEPNQQAAILPEMESLDEMPAKKVATSSKLAEDKVLQIVNARPEQAVSDPVAALKL